MRSMATWETFEKEALDLASAVRARFEAEKHHVLATIRADGSPRASGTEVLFRSGEAVVGSMWQARKALDLQRDPRFAIHANPGQGSQMASGDAKISGLAVEVTDDDEKAAYVDAADPPGPSHYFLLDLQEAVLTTVEGDKLLVQLWRPGRGVERFDVG